MKYDQTFIFWHSKTGTIAVLLICCTALITLACSSTRIATAGSSSSTSLDQAKMFRSLIKQENYEEAQALLAPDPRRWWGKRSGEGEPWIIRPGYSGPWGAWDDHFQTEQKIVEWKKKGNAVSLVLRETNDYFRLLERGWVTNEITYFFNTAGQIEGLLIRGLGERPPGKTDVFLAWARKNDPEELELLMPDGEIDPSGDHPQRFRILLNRWRVASGLEPIEIRKSN